eukprot:gene19379-26028_t
MSAPSLPPTRACCLCYILHDKHWERGTKSMKVRVRPEGLTLVEGFRAEGRPRPDAALSVICNRCFAAHTLELNRIGDLAPQHEGVLPAAAVETPPSARRRGGLLSAAAATAESSQTSIVATTLAAGYSPSKVGIVGGLFSAVKGAARIAFSSKARRAHAQADDELQRQQSTIGRLVVTMPASAAAAPDDGLQDLRQGDRDANDQRMRRCQNQVQNGSLTSEEATSISSASGNGR